MPAVALDADTQPAAADTVGSDHRSRRRFTYAAITGTLVASVPYLWILMDQWFGAYHPFRLLNPDAFYDEQAEAIIHGHLWVPKGTLGIEGFVHDGHTYTYFGLLLSLFRIPILLVAPHLQGRLTAPSMFVAWVAAGVFTSLLFWRVRILLRGDAVMGRAEAVSFGVLVAAVMGGSILLFLSAAPWVYDEDLAWTVPVTVATLFVFLGVLDRPSKGRVLAAGGLVLAGVLGRPPPGLACVVGAVLIAAWFGLGRAGPESRRWALPMLGVGLGPLAVYCFVNWLKFGTFLNGLPLADQVWTHVNAHRRVFLASTGGKGYSFHFIPTTLWAYLQPFGLRVQPTFPFLTLPVEPPHVFGGYIVDILYPTPSAPTTMPLLFLLSCWALLVAFRPGAGRGTKLMRIPLIVGIGATSVDFLLGYIAPRYLADFLPFFILGAAIGMVDLWRRLERRRIRAKRVALGAVVVLAVFSMAANVGLALSPTTEWLPLQATGYVQAVKAISDITGHPLRDQTEYGSVLPYWAPANELFVVGDCSGLYLSSGDHFHTVLTLEQEHRTWVPVERGAGVDSTMTVTFNTPVSQLGRGVPLFSVGRDTVLVRSAGNGQVRYVLEDPQDSNIGQRVRPQLGHSYYLLVQADTMMHYLIVRMGKFNIVLTGTLSGAGPGITPTVVHTQPPVVSGPPAPLTVVALPTAPPDMSLCRSLLVDR